MKTVVNRSGRNSQRLMILQFVSIRVCTANNTKNLVPWLSILQSIGSNKFDHGESHVGMDPIIVSLLVVLQLKFCSVVFLLTI